MTKVAEGTCLISPSPPTLPTTQMEQAKCIIPHPLSMPHNHRTKSKPALLHPVPPTIPPLTAEGEEGGSFEADKGHKEVEVH